jgi:hypothetical protein
MVRMPWSLSLCHPCASIYLRTFKCLCVHLAAYIQVHALTHALRMHAIVSLSACHPSPSRVRVRERESARARARANERARYRHPVTLRPRASTHSHTLVGGRGGGACMTYIHVTHAHSFRGRERERARPRQREKRERDHVARHTQSAPAIPPCPSPLNCPETDRRKERE